MARFDEAITANHAAPTSANGHAARRTVAAIAHHFGLGARPAEFGANFVIPTQRNSQQTVQPSALLASA